VLQIHAFLQMRAGQFESDAMDNKEDSSYDDDY